MALNKLSKILLIILYLIVCGIYIVYRNNLEGDPAIFFSFCKHFWQSPFSFGIPGRVCFGATSPFYVIIGAILHLSGNVMIFFYSLKIVALLMIFTSIYLLSIIILRIFNIDQNKKWYIVLLASFCYFFNSHLFYNSTFLYESFLVIFYISFLLYLYFTSQKLITIIIASISYLIRPEIVVIQIIIVCIYIFHDLKKRNYLSILFIILISLVPTVTYHLYMYHHTGLLIPTSITSRHARYGVNLFDIKSHLILMVKNYKYFFISLPLAILLSFLAVIKRKIKINNFILFIIPLLTAVAIFLKNGSIHLPVRYFDFSIPFIIIILVSSILHYSENTIKLKINILPDLIILLFVIGFYFGDFFLQEYINHNGDIILLKKIFIILLIVTGLVFLVRKCNSLIPLVSLMCIVLISISAMFNYGWFNRDSKVFNRLDKEFGDKINKIVKKDEVIAMYEIELQYFVDRKMVSIDGIAGEPVFLSGSFEDVMRSGLVQYVGIDQHIYYPGLGYAEELYKKGSQIKINQFLIFDNIKFTKVLEDDGRYVYRMWKYIYKIDRLKE